MKENKIAPKNYIIIALIFAATISLTLYLCNCYSVYGTVCQSFFPFGSDPYGDGIDNGHCLFDKAGDWKTILSFAMD